MYGSFKLDILPTIEASRPEIESSNEPLLRRRPILQARSVVERSS